MSGTATTTDTELELRADGRPVTTVTIQRSAVFGRQYRLRKPDLPSLTAEVDVPPALVDAARELYAYYHDQREGGRRPEQSFAEYLHDVVMDQIRLELRYPPSEDSV